MSKPIGLEEKRWGNQECGNASRGWGRRSGSERCGGRKKPQDSEQFAEEDGVL